MSHDAAIACGHLHRPVDVNGSQLRNTWSAPVTPGTVYEPVHGSVRVLVDEVLLERGQRSDRLERRARRVDRRGRAVERRVVLAPRRLGVEQRLQLLLVDPAREDAGPERRVRRHREDVAGVRVERDDRAAVRRPLAVLVRERDAVLERALGGALEPDVDRQADRSRPASALASACSSLFGRPSESTRSSARPASPRRTCRMRPRHPTGRCGRRRRSPPSACASAARPRSRPRSRAPARTAASAGYERRYVCLRSTPGNSPWCSSR